MLFANEVAEAEQGARQGHSIKGKGSHIHLKNNSSYLHVIEMFKENDKTKLRRTKTDSLSG